MSLAIVYGTYPLTAQLIAPREPAADWRPRRRSGLITAADLRTFLHLLDDPEFTFTMPLLVSAWGRR